MKSSWLTYVSFFLSLSVGQMLAAGDLCRGECHHEKILREGSGQTTKHSCHEKKEAAASIATQKEGCGDMGRCYLLGELENDPVFPASQIAYDFSFDPVIIAGIEVLYGEFSPFQDVIINTFLSRPPPGLRQGRAVLLQKESFLI